MLAHFGTRKQEYYRGLLVKADLNLHAQVAERLSRLCAAPAKVLDFGAGQGALSLRLSEAGYEVTAADIDRASFKCPTARFVQIDFNDKAAVEGFIAEHQAYYDAVLGVEVIEHIENPWEYIRSLASMLRPGGVILVTTPNITSWLSRFRFLFTGQFQHFGEAQLGYGHIAPISAWELELVLKQSGLFEVAVVSAGTLPPVFVTGFNGLLLANLFMLPLRPFMRGLLDGWCVMATGRKP
jgi:SAM-dependent methyltransferase